MTPSDGHYVFVEETHFHPGTQTVYSAAEAIAQLPNGWKLVSLEFEQTEIVAGVWKAVVQGPKEKRT